MSRLPRASLTITILQDEDFATLVKQRGGMEAFGFFVAVLVVGRERLQRGRAQQLSNTESLRFDDSTDHVLGMVYSNRKQLDKCLEVFDAVTRANSSKPWLHLDKSGHLVIRSFFRWNTNTGWGGPRSGSGRKSRGNQDDSENNHLETNLESSWCASGSGSGTGSKDPPTPPKGDAALPLVPNLPDKGPIVIDSASARCPDYPDPDFGAPRPGPNTLTEAQAVEIHGLLWNTFKNRRVCYEFHVHQKSLSAEAWKFAIGKVVWKVDNEGFNLRGAVYLVTIGGDYGKKPNRSAFKPEPKPDPPLEYAEVTPEDDAYLDQIYAKQKEINEKRNREFHENKLKNAK